MTGIATVATMAALVVNPSFPAKSVPEFIAYAKDNRTNVASAGVGSISHL